MSKKRNDWKDERGAVVLAPQPVKRGSLRCWCRTRSEAWLAGTGSTFGR